MIKKTTKAIFLDGGYKGEYDWKGGIPLSQGEVLSVRLDNNSLNYKLIKKEVSYDIKEEDQIVVIVYTFELA